uniref:Uncharacterized protein n=1 Tax=Setaria viridis TaxID=4556 RepID=A0A4U6VEH7_SETVI|nr:hypothetical protein SEVIR_4G229901v2 [Setaria viridis]
MSWSCWPWHVRPNRGIPRLSIAVLALSVFGS